MAIINYNAFRVEVFQWALQQNNRFHLFWPLNGGWEPWVQAEVAGHIINANSTYEILREQGIYTNGQVADWALNQQTGGNNRIAVELKCQRGTDLQGTTFFNDIQGDDDKLTAGDLPVGVQGAIVGIYYSQNAYNRINNAYNLTNYNHNTFNQSIGVFVFFMGVDF